MSAIGGKADIVWHVAMSANDPKRTLRLITDIAILDSAGYRSKLWTPPR